MKNDKTTVAVRADINNPVSGTVLSVTLLDADGNVAAKGETAADSTKAAMNLELPKADTLLHFTCEGAGEFLASDNGD